MAEISELRMNVAALKRVDPYVKEILGTATHVALYTFNAETNEWERTDVEGALFVYSRNGEPFHGILIMNRLNTNNLVEPVVQGLEMQLQEPFLLYRNTRFRIFGIWFYDKDQCTRIAAMLNKLVKELDHQKKLPEKNTLRNKTISSGTGGTDIFSMLNKAQEDYNSNKVPGKNKSSVENKSLSGSDVPPKSVMDFFAKATGSVSQFTAPHFTAPHPQRPTLVRDSADSNQLKPLIQRLMSNPAHTVEHIEKQQRSVTPQAENAVSENTQIKKAIKIVNGNGLKLQPLPGSAVEPPKGVIPIEACNPKPFTEQSSVVENSMNFLRISSPNSTAPPLTPFFGTIAQPIATNGIALDSALDQRSSSAPTCNAETPSKLPLMPPTMFTASAAKEVGAKAVTKCELPAAAVLPSNSCLEESSIPIRPEPLTKNQLLQAFNYLLKTDAEFVNKLHEAYVKSFSDIVHS